MISPLPQFTYFGKTALLMPGKKFTKNELISRLHQMDVQFDQSSLLKQDFIDLYENALKYDVNKIKIFDRLLKDTFYYEQTKNKKNNISENDLDSPVRNNNIIGQDNLRNRNYISNEYGDNHIQKQNINFYNYNQGNKNYENDNNQNNHKYPFKEAILGEITKNQNEIINNNQNQNNYFDYRNKEQNNTYLSREPNIKYEENITQNQQYTNQKYDNNYNNNWNYNNRYNSNYNNEIRNKYNNNQLNNNQQNYNPNQYQQNINNKGQFIYKNQTQNNTNYQNNVRNNMNYNNNFPQNDFYNKKNNINQEYQEYRDENRINYNNNEKYERKNCILEKDKYQDINYNNTMQYNNDNNNNNKNAISLSIENAIKDNNQNNKVNNSQYHSNIRERRAILSNQKGEEYYEDEDVHSNFSIMTKFDKIKNYFENKENRDFCLHILQMIIVAFIFFAFISFGFRFSSSIKEKIIEGGKAIANPKKLLLGIIWGLIKGIIVGILWKYIYRILFLAVIAFFVYYNKNKYDFKKLCEKIVQDIKNDLRNKPVDQNGRHSISENEIILKYAKKYNIDYNTFAKKYLKQLKELRKKDYTLKEYSIMNQGNPKTIWELKE